MKINRHHLSVMCAVLLMGIWGLKSAGSQGAGAPAAQEEAGLLNRLPYSNELSSVLEASAAISKVGFKGVSMALNAALVAKDIATGRVPAGWEAWGRVLQGGLFLGVAGTVYAKRDRLETIVKLGLVLQSIRFILMVADRLSSQDKEKIAQLMAEKKQLEDRLRSYEPAQALPVSGGWFGQSASAISHWWSGSKAE